jgi:3-oxoadipate enol-lactonase
MLGTKGDDLDARYLRKASAASAGETIYAERTGCGTAIVFCHGLGGNHAIWWRQIDAFSRKHTVVTWDQRGFGNSSAITGRSGVEEGTADLAAVLDAFTIGEAHLVGQSMGAFVALRFAIENPARVLSLTLSTTLAGADSELSRNLLRSVPPRPLRDRHPVVSVPTSQEETDLVVLYNQISSFGAKPPAAAMLESMAQQEFTDAELGTLACPVLLVAAEQDSLCPPAVMRKTAQRFAKAEFATIAGVGHSAYFERPALWNEAVLSFLAKHS